MLFFPEIIHQLSLNHGQNSDVTHMNEMRLKNNIKLNMVQP